MLVVYTLLSGSAKISDLDFFVSFLCGFKNMENKFKSCLKIRPTGLMLTWYTL